MRGGCIAGFWTQGFSTIYMDKPVASRFGQMVKRIQDWLILIPFRVIAFTIFLSQFRLTKNGRESLRLIFENGFEDMKSKFLPGIFQQENSRMPFQTFRLFQEFSTQTSKTIWNWVNGKPGKAPSSRFMIHTRCHTSIWASFWHPRSLLSVLRSGRGGILPIMAYTERIRPNWVPFSGFRYMKG